MVVLSFLHCGHSKSEQSSTEYVSRVPTLCVQGQQPPPPPPITRVPDCVCEWKNLDDRARHFSLTPWRLSLLSSHDASQIFASNLVACTPWITQANVNLMSNNFVAEIAKFEVQRLQS